MALLKSKETKAVQKEVNEIKEQVKQEMEDENAVKEKQDRLLGNLRKMRESGGDGTVSAEEKDKIKQCFLNGKDPGHFFGNIPQNVLVKNPDLVLYYFEQFPGQICGLRFVKVMGQREQAKELQINNCIPMEFFTEENADKLKELYKGYFVKQYEDHCIRNIGGIDAKQRNEYEEYLKNEAAGFKKLLERRVELNKEEKSPAKIFDELEPK